MAEIKEEPQEILIPSEDVKELNSELLKKLRKSLRSYPSIGELLSKKRVDLLNPSGQLLTADFEYIFTRIASDNLELSIEKRPFTKNENLVEERIDMVIGDNPLIQHDITLVGKLKQPPKKNTPEAAKEVVNFLSELEQRL